jgi:hypothetical protein
VANRIYIRIISGILRFCKVCFLKIQLSTLLLEDTNFLSFPCFSFYISCRCNYLSNLFLFFSFPFFLSFFSGTSRYKLKMILNY